MARAAFRPAFLLMAMSLALSAHAQTRTLADLLRTSPPPAPWIAVAPESVTAKRAASDLAAFERKAMKIGSLTAVVPTTMVLIDDPLATDPDLDDGLPRSSKILALMATLTPQQWRLLGGRGLGLDDLRSEPRKILQSLLPRPFKWDRYHVRDGVTHMRETERLTLPERDVNRVRLRLSREISLMVHPQGQRGFFGLSEGRVRKNGTYGELDTKGEADSSFGVAIRQTVPNRPKPGGVRFEDRAYDARIALAGARTVRDLLAAASRATGREFLADLRVADLPIASSGDETRVGDALGAVALAVTGTYRPVGPGFVLTSDLVGLGTRKARIDRWRAGLTNGVRERADEWRRAILASGGMRAVGYPEGARLRADEELQAQLDQPTRPGAPNETPVSALPPGFRDLLDERAKLPGLPPIDLERVGLQSRVRFSFVLPDGTEVLGDASVPVQPGPTRPAIPERPTPPVVPPVAMPEGERAASLLLTAESPDEAEGAIVLAEAYGFRELWLETHDAATLKAAVARAGRPVRLAVRPWTAPLGAKVADPDRTPFGDRARDVVERKLRDMRATRFVTPTPPTPLGRDLLAPFDPQTPARWRRFAELARTPGLAGVVVLDAQPGGYVEPAGRTGLADGDADFGYAEGQRWAFLKENRIDPIDMVFRDGLGELELRQPFFPDNNLASLAAMNDEGRRPEPEAQTKAPERWRTFRAEANRRAVESLLAALGPVTIHVQPRRRDASGGTLAFGPLLEWKAGSPLPTVDLWDPAGPGFRVRALRAEPSMDEAGLRAALANPERTRTDQTTLDLSDVPAPRREAVLNRILNRKAEPGRRADGSSAQACRPASVAASKLRRPEDAAYRRRGPFLSVTPEPK